MKTPKFTFLTSILLSLFCFLMSHLAIAQSFYELKFNDDAGNVYNCFLVYFNEEDSYMRIAYNTNKKYKVVNVQYTAQTGEEDGMNYMLLTGKNPSYITDSYGDTYNPDYFLWVWKNKSEDAELPYVTDDPELNQKNFRQVSSYKEIKASELTSDYLRQFYRTDEADFLTFKNMINERKEDENYNNPNTNDSERPTMHCIIVANTAINDIGTGCKVDKQNLLNEFEDIADALQIDFQKYVIEDKAFTRANVEQTLEDLEPSSNDIVIFIYRGHGFRWSNQTKKFPQMDFRYSNYQRFSQDASLNLEDVYALINKKGGRLNIVMGDCCNSDIGINQNTPTTLLTPQANMTPKIPKLKRLFLESKGSLIVASSSPGEVSWVNTVSGGFFTVSFIQALHEEISHLRKDEADWAGLIQNSIKYARHKSSPSVCSNCTLQNGIYSSTITYK